MYLRGMTHLYVPDDKRFKQVRNGLLIKAQVKTFETPQGVKTNIIKTDAKGNPFSLDEINKNTVYSKGNRRWKKI